MTPADQQLLKHAQNEIIALCGGLTAVANLTSYGRSTVGRWADVGDPSLMPLPAVIRLEKTCKVPVISAVMAMISNRRLSDAAEDAAPVKCLMTAFSEAFAVSGELSSSFASAISDGKFTPNELTELDRVLGVFDRTLDDCRKTAAAARAAGGLKLSSVA